MSDDSFVPGPRIWATAEARARRLRRVPACQSDSAAGGPAGCGGRHPDVAPERAAGTPACKERAVAFAESLRRSPTTAVPGKVEPLVTAIGMSPIRLSDANRREDECDPERAAGRSRGGDRRSMVRRARALSCMKSRAVPDACDLRMQRAGWRQQPVGAGDLDDATAHGIVYQARCLWARLLASVFERRSATDRIEARVSERGRRFREQFSTVVTVGGRD